MSGGRVDSAGNVARRSKRAHGGRSQNDTSQGPSISDRPAHGHQSAPAADRPATTSRSFDPAGLGFEGLELVVTCARHRLRNWARPGKKGKARRCPACAREKAANHRGGPTRARLRAWDHAGPAGGGRTDRVEEVSLDTWDPLTDGYPTGGVGGVT